MFFTEEDYKKIEKYLASCGVKDSCLEDAKLPIEGNEKIAIVQNGENRILYIRELIEALSNSKASLSDLYNVTDHAKEKYINLKQAIELVPYKARKIGQIITFLNPASKWELYQFQGTSILQWNELSLWNDFFNLDSYVIKSILPDEEDLTKSENDGKGNSYLSLKDREYNPDEFSGLGKVILRKNIMEVETENGKVKKNVLLQDMINKPNTIYEIRYDFDLNGEDIVIPENSVLSFTGGMLINGKIVGNKTRLSNFVKFNNVTIDGVFENEFCKTSYYTGNTNKNVDNINNLFKISRNLIIDSKNYIISKQLILPCDVKISCDIGCSILLTDLGCIYVTHSNRLSNIDVYIDKGIKNTEHLIVIDTEYIYKSIENTPKSYPSLFNIYIENLFIDHNGKTIDKIIDIYNDSNKNGWNINISDCVFQCSSNIAISLVTKGKGSWLNNTYFNNVKTVYSEVGFYIDGVEGSIPPENVSIIQCSMQCISTSTYFVKARAVHRLYVFFCEPWDWNSVETNPFLFTPKCEGVNIVSSGAYSNYDFDGDRTSAYNTINYMCSNYSANVGNFYSLPEPPKNGSTYTLKEIQTMPRGIYKIPSDSKYGQMFGVTSPIGGFMIIDGGSQGSIFITYYDMNKELYFYSNTNVLEYVEDRIIKPSDWVKIGNISQTEIPLPYNQYKLYRNYNDKLYFLAGDGNKIDCLGRTFLKKESTDGLDVSKLTNFLNIGRVLYSPNHNKLAMWNGTKLIDAFGYDEAYLKKGESSRRPNVDSSQLGFQYYDTTLKKYIVWNGTEWTNMDGTSL